MKLSDFFSSYGLSAFMSQDEVIQDFNYGRRLPCIILIMLRGKGHNFCSLYIVVCFACV